MPYLRAAPVAVSPGSKLSATISRFCSISHTRRCSPRVMISTGALRALLRLLVRALSSGSGNDTTLSMPDLHHSEATPSWVSPPQRLPGMFRAISSYCGAQTGGPLGSKELVLTDDNGDQHLFPFETFFIRYRPPAIGDALTLGVYIKPHLRMLAA